MLTNLRRIKGKGRSAETTPDPPGEGLKSVLLFMTLTGIFLLALQDIIEGGNLRAPLQELHQMILTPIKAYTSPSTTPEARHREPLTSQSSLMGPESQRPDCKDGGAGPAATGSAGASGGLQPHQLSTCDGELAIAPLPEGDLPGQFTRVMGKVCTQLLVSRPDEENISSYLQLIDKCLIHEVSRDETFSKTVFFLA